MHFQAVSLRGRIGKNRDYRDHLICGDRPHECPETDEIVRTGNTGSLRNHLSGSQKIGVVVTEAFYKISHLPIKRLGFETILDPGANGVDDSRPISSVEVWIDVCGFDRVRQFVKKCELFA